MPLYFLSLLPPEDLRQKIRKLKEEISEKYHTRKALRLPAHLTLQAPFRIERNRVPELDRRLEAFCNTQRVLRVELKGFGAFPPKVIFLKVVNPETVRVVQARLEKYLENLVPAEKGGRIFHPHITLATRDISRPDFKKAWENLEHDRFSAVFQATAIYLFRHDGKKWNLAQEYSFSPA